MGGVGGGIRKDFPYPDYTAISRQLNIKLKSLSQLLQ
jgi:hypothetical protein